MQIYISFKKRREYRDTTGDPWDGRTLEWSIPSPPHLYNFAVIPEVHERDPFWVQKRSAIPKPVPRYEDIHMPSNTSIGFFIGIFSAAASFGIIWYMWWLVIIGTIGIIICTIIRLCDEHPEYTIPADEVRRMEMSR